jgi:hypothetical protein
MAIVAIWLRSPHSPRKVIMKVCTQAGLSKREKRLLSPASALLMLEPPGEGDRAGEDEGLRAGAGRREFDRDRLARPDSRT